VSVSFSSQGGKKDHGKKSIFNNMLLGMCACQTTPIDDAVDDGSYEQTFPSARRLLVEATPPPHLREERREIRRSRAMSLGDDMEPVSDYPYNDSPLFTDPLSAPSNTNTAAAASTTTTNLSMLSLRPNFEARKRSHKVRGRQSGVDEEKTAERHSQSRIMVTDGPLRIEHDPTQPVSVLSPISIPRDTAPLSASAVMKMRMDRYPFSPSPFIKGPAQSFATAATLDTLQSNASLVSRTIEDDENNEHCTISMIRNNMSSGTVEDVIIAAFDDDDDDDTSYGSLVLNDAELDSEGSFRIEVQQLKEQNIFRPISDDDEDAPQDIVWEGQAKFCAHDSTKMVVEEREEQQVDPRCSGSSNSSRTTSETDSTSGRDSDDTETDDAHDEIDENSHFPGLTRMYPDHCIVDDSTAFAASSRMAAGIPIQT